MTPPQALGDVRVIDFTTGPAGGLATTVLADFGAEVIKVEPPGGDRFRTLAASPFWLRGKHSIELDLLAPTGAQRARELIATADVVVAAGSLERQRRLGLDGSALRAGHPSLIHCSISGWGTTGRDAELPGYEGLVAARAGRMAAFDVQLQQGRPVFAAVPVATHIASQAAVQGIVAALYRRMISGQGDIVETSLLQSLMPFDLVDLLSRQLAERDGRRFRPLRTLSPMPTLNYHPIRTADGVWLQCGNLLEHLFYSFLDAIDLLGELLIDERFQSSPAQWEPDAIEEARDRILIRVQERTAAEWMTAFTENGNVAAEPIVDTTAALAHPDLVEGRALVTLDDPVHGTTTQIGPIAELSATPAVVRRPAPALGEHDERAVTARTSATPSFDNGFDLAGSHVAGRPLEEVTVLDLSTIIAGPLAGSILADLGARVIKVEPFLGDPFRYMLTQGRMAVKTNAGKESISIDLKTDSGQQILHQLAVDADVVVHNFRGAVPDKLGIDSNTLRAINPDLVVAVINGYGPHGPSAPRPATHPVMGAAAGGVAYQAGAALTRECLTLDDVRENARQIMAANEANPDPNTSVVAASAILLALYAVRRHGVGQDVHVSMQVANAWANHDDFLDYQGKPARMAVDAGYHGLNACYRLYPTADGWVFVAAATDAEFAELCRHSACPELASDARFATRQARVANDDELAAELTAMFGQQTADEWESQLAASGVGCLRADNIDVGGFWCKDQHVVDSGWTPLVTHTRFGIVRRWGPVVTVGGLNPHYRAAPLAGEHTDKILGELGYDGDQIMRLRADRIVNSEAV